MENHSFEFVIEDMQAFLDEQGFKALGEGVYATDTKQIKIEYSQDAQVYRLLAADVSEEGVGEYTELSAYLFDASQTKRDAASVGIDFVDTLRKNMGVKIARRGASGQIDLPTNEKKGNVTIGGMTAKLLAIYPEFKDIYKQSVATHGKFLHIEFYRDNFIPRINRALTENNKKQLKKLFDMLADCYISGDKDTGTLVVATLTAACDGDSTLFDTAKATMGEGSYLIPLVTNFIPELNKNKKLREAIIK